MQERFELHQSGYEGPYYVITEAAAAAPRVLISSDRTVACGSLSAMLAAQRLCAPAPMLRWTLARDLADLGSPESWRSVVYP